MRTGGKRATLVAGGLCVLGLALPGGAAAAVPTSPSAGEVKKICAKRKTANAALAKANRLVARRTAAAKRKKGGAKKRAQDRKKAADTLQRTAKTAVATAKKECKTARARFADAKNWTRSILMASLALILIVAAFLQGLYVGKDNRVSTSKSAAAVWTALLAGALLGVVVAKLAGYPQAIDKIIHSGLAGQYGLLIGAPLGAALAAKGIVGRNVSKKPGAKTAAKSANPLQVVQDDAGSTDLGDFQYVLFNLVAMLYFVGTLLQSPVDGLPEIPDVLLGLTSVAALGYVGKKALPDDKAIDVKPDANKQNVTITGVDLLETENAQDTPVTVLFGSKAATVGPIAHMAATGRDTITAAVPDGLTPGETVNVVVVTPRVGVVHAGTFSPNDE